MSKSESDEGNEFPVYYAVTLGLIFGWICCCCITTKGCTDCSYRDRSEGLEDDPVWGVRRMERRELEDHRLAVELQERELAQSRSPEELEADRLERERRIQARQTYIKKHLKSFPYSEKENIEGISGAIEIGPVDESHHTEYDEEQDQANRCTICMEKYKVGEIMTTSDTGQCSHTFHYKCMADWLIRKAMCPICRNTFMSVDVKHERAQEALQQQEARTQEQDSEIG